MLMVMQKSDPNAVNEVVNFFHLLTKMDPAIPLPLLRLCLNFNYFTKLGKGEFLQLIKFFSLNFVYNCCWFVVYSSVCVVAISFL